ncbi:MAG: hypothetical protein MUE96_12405 [Bacteroidia bacterium]|jgi:hypothetical protein|nr:hypothetical protein [Bacteroidia bacterium]
MIAKVFVFLCCVASVVSSNAQQAMTFQEAEAQGIRISFLDSTYPSAMNVDTALAVFKTDVEQQAMYNAYYKLLQDFGAYLHANKYAWDKPTRCFNRIYFSPEGRIDYFLFNFLGKTESENPSVAQQQAFKRLLNGFISDYQFEVKASTKFAQCSPTTYKP